jgi:hypothetical protein
VTLTQEVSNREGWDFLLNMWTYRVTSDHRHVKCAYVRFTDEEIHDGDALQMMRAVDHGMQQATGEHG